MTKTFPTVESAAVFYAEQARLIAKDPEQAEVYKVALETAEMLLRLHEIEKASAVPTAGLEGRPLPILAAEGDLPMLDEDDPEWTLAANEVKRARVSGITEQESDRVLYVTLGSLRILERQLLYAKRDIAQLQYALEQSESKWSALLAAQPASIVSGDEPELDTNDEDRKNAEGMEGIWDSFADLAADYCCRVRQIKEITHRAAPVVSGDECKDLCKCGHEREDHRDEVFECGCADRIDGVDVECCCDDFEDAAPVVSGEREAPKVVVTEEHRKLAKRILEKRYNCNWNLMHEEDLSELIATRELLVLTSGAIEAQDERERQAAERVDMVHSCDWPDEVADVVLTLRAQLAQAKEGE
jgi:hypothetical protein